MIVLGHMIFFGLYKEAVSRELNEAGIFKDGGSNGRGKVCSLYRFYCFTYIISRRYLIIEVLYFIWTTSYWFVEELGKNLDLCRSIFTNIHQSIFKDVLLKALIISRYI